MPLWTTYLGFFRKLAHDYDDALFDISEKLQEKYEVKSVIPYFIMRNRGNNEVAPSAELLQKYKSVEPTYKASPKIVQTDWQKYKDEYLKGLTTKEAQEWMELTAEECNREGCHVILICYEGPRYGNRCHRFLLANYMKEHFGCDYKGELSTLF